MRIRRRKGTAADRRAHSNVTKKIPFLLFVKAEKTNPLLKVKVDWNARDEVRDDHLRTISKNVISHLKLIHVWRVERRFLLFLC